MRIATFCGDTVGCDVFAIILDALERLQLVIMRKTTFRQYFYAIISIDLHALDNIKICLKRPDRLVNCFTPGGI